MRCQLRIGLKGTPPFLIPVTYRRDILSMLKEALKGDEQFFNKYYGVHRENRQKPFTFALYIPHAESIKNKNGSFLKTDHPYLTLKLSSSDLHFFITLYNQLLQLKNYKIFDQEVHLSRFRLEEKPIFTDREATFRVVSPVIVRKIENHKGRGYLSFEDDHFKDNLIHSIINLAQNFSDFVPRYEEIDIIPKRCKRVIVSNYGGEIGTTGIITIKAPVKVLELIYLAGLGAKRGQGFGFLEVVK